MKGRKAKDKNMFILLSILLISSILLSSFAKNKTINKTEFNSLKPLDQEGQNYRLVTSADNVQVPVPKGYVASQITGENYVSPEYQHTTIQHKGNYTQLNWSSPAGEQYPWTQDENGIWISGNQGIPNSTSTLESEEFDYIKGTTLTINYTFSCRGSNYFSLYIINLTNNITDTIVKDRTGNTGSSFDYTTSNYTYTMNDWATGRYKIKVTYSKKSMASGGLDSGYIKPLTYFKKNENGTQIFEEDIKTKIHDGGFVIYQLTDEEIETNPNGTNVIINDTNKDDEQSERNQYVWVPVPNVEDIIRTKTDNNITMQFGQGYEFSNNLIRKENGTSSIYFREPRIIERADKTKYNLQKFIDINKRENYLNNQQEDFTRMTKSINKYKGFYIGRYETGDDYTHSTSKGEYKNPRIVRYNKNIEHVSWYDSYKKQQRLTKNTDKYVKTGMIYDNLFDYTLKWLNETETLSYLEISEDSGRWGNYGNCITKYKDSANGIEQIKEEDISDISATGGVTEITYKGETISDFPTKTNNIFDMGGNAWEWTINRYDNTCATYRAGGCDSVSVNTYTIIVSVHPFYHDYFLGTRAQLYIL